MIKLFIYGAGGHAKVVWDACRLNGIEVVAFVVDPLKEPGLAKRKSDFLGLPLIEASEPELDSIRTQTRQFIVAIGNNQIRAEKQQKLVQQGFLPYRVFHPSSIISKTAEIGEGTFVGAGAIVNAYAAVGDGSILNTSCIVEHDCILGSYVHISPGAKLAGGVKVGTKTQVGIGSSVIENVEIGEGVLIGAGSAVVRSIPDFQTAYGVPARVKPFSKPDS